MTGAGRKCVRRPAPQEGDGNQPSTETENRHVRGAHSSQLARDEGGSGCQDSGSGERRR